MRYCPRCEAEYRDDVKSCTEDGAILMDAAEHAALARKRHASEIVGRLVSVLALADGFEADELASGLADEGLDVSLVSNRTDTLATLTDPGPEIFNVVVPEAQAERARAFLAEWRPQLEASEPEAESAAEREEATGEATGG
jgi:hypothetical protein